MCADAAHASKPEESGALGCTCRGCARTLSELLLMVARSRYLW